MCPLMAILVAGQCYQEMNLREDGWFQFRHFTKDLKQDNVTGHEHTEEQDWIYPTDSFYVKKKEDYFVWFRKKVVAGVASVVNGDDKEYCQNQSKKETTSSSSQNQSPLMFIVVL